MQLTFRAFSHLCLKFTQTLPCWEPGAGTWPQSRCDANLDGETGNERLRKRQALKEASPSLPLRAWIDLAKNKTRRTPPWLRCIHRWTHRPSVTSDATCIIQPGFIYVEIELLSAKLRVCSSLGVGAPRSVAVSCQLKRRSQNNTTLTDWRIRLHLRWPKHCQTNPCILCRFHY